MEEFLSVIVKPTTECGLHCKHCYHRPSERDSGVLDLGVFEKTVRLVREGYAHSRYIWHGGEPLILPQSFYKKAFSLQRRHYGKIGCDNTIQTNGSQLSQRFIGFCKSNRVNLGISYEGGFDAGLRPDTDNDHIDRMVRYMVDKGHMFLVSATIHGGNVDMMGDIYEKFKNAGASVSFNPVINLGCATADPDLRLDPDRFVKNSIELFDRWLLDRDVGTPILPFYPYVMTVLEGRPNISDCPHASCLGNWICLYPNGDVYPCGKACPKEFRMGNINDVDSIEELFDSDGFRNILVASIERRNKCRTCEIYDFCNGGCSIDAMADGDIGSPGGIACSIYKGLMPHIKDTIDDILRNRPDMNRYNGFIRDAIMGKLINPKIPVTPSFQ